MSHYLFISVVEPVLPASSANEHCFAVDVTLDSWSEARI